MAPLASFGHDLKPETIQQIRASFSGSFPSDEPIRLAQATPSAASVGVSFNSKRVSIDPAEVFGVFSPRVQLRRENDFLLIESNGIPSHPMMIGIIAWQQQVPLPQAYTGSNAWRLPLNPVPAKQPQTIRNHFLRGAVALAANGIPIFNPQNNRGEISQEIGELDQWGGHCGLADDYHYHAAPLHLQKALGPNRPIAYALDGYPIYGLTEPDGRTAANLDAFNGHDSSSLGYHYHASLKYPYVNGGFFGEVVELNDQVDPQPRAQPVRQGQPPLRGAQITGFCASPDEKNFSVQYSVNSKPALVRYAALPDGGWKFQFTGTDGVVREETYRGGDRRDPRGENGTGRPPKGDRPPPGDRPARGGGANPVEEVAPVFVPKRSGQMVLTSSAVPESGVLPVEYTGDGAGISPPVEWKGGPPETKSYALVMHHIDPEGKAKWYWTLYNIPSDIRSLPKNAQGIGILGTNSVNDRIGYAPPHSKGPGPKTYIFTVYALSAEVKFSIPAAQVNRGALLGAIKDLVLDSAELKVAYSR
ncbi:MAG: YHYH protein [Verrucomicrobiota bacterium]